MKDTIRKVEYYKVMVPNKPGASEKILVALGKARVSLLALCGFPRAGRAQLDLFPKDPDAFRKALRKAGISPGKAKAAFLIQGPDRAGAGWEVGDKLGKAGINITAMHAVAARGRQYGAILWVKPGDVARTAKVLGAS